MGLIYSTGKGLGQKTVPSVIHPDRADRIQTPRLSSNRVSWERGQKRAGSQHHQVQSGKDPGKTRKGQRHPAVSVLPEGREAPFSTLPSGTQGKMFVRPGNKGTSQHPLNWGFHIQLGQTLESPCMAEAATGHPSTARPMGVLCVELGCTAGTRISVGLKHKSSETWPVMGSEHMHSPRLALSANRVESLSAAQ